jgi:hypothetical protein
VARSSSIHFADLIPNVTSPFDQSLDRPWREVLAEDTPRPRPFAPGLSLLLIVAITFSAATAPREALSGDWGQHRGPDRAALLTHTAVRSAHHAARRDRVVPAIVLILARAQRVELARAGLTVRGTSHARALSPHVLDLPPPALA